MQTVFLDSGEHLVKSVEIGGAAADGGALGRRALYQHPSDVCRRHRQTEYEVHLVSPDRDQVGSDITALIKFTKTVGKSRTVPAYASRVPNVPQMDRRSMMLMAGLVRWPPLSPFSRPGRTRRTAYHRPLRRPMLPAPTFSRTSSTARPVPPPIRRTGRCRTGRTTCGRRSWGYTATIAETCSSTATPISSCSPHEKATSTSAANCAATGGCPSATRGKREIKLDCLTPGLWPSFWAVNEDPLPDGEVDIFEWYGNGVWPPGTTVHAASNGKTWEGRSIPGLVDGGVAQLANALGRRRFQILARLR